MGKIQTILIALDLTVGFLVASTSLQAALTSTAVVSGSTTAVVAADPISYQGDSPTVVLLPVVPTIFSSP